MKKIKELEPKIYELLGVLFFQKCVFKLEKIIHFKDKGKNINYHIKNYNIDQLEEFKKFLYFNGYIHLRNLLILLPVLVIQSIFFSPLFLLYTIPAIIKNAYCVMLQRYNYIRISKLAELKKKQIELRNSKKIEKIKENDRIQKLKQDDLNLNLEQIKNLKNFIQGTEDIYLDEQSLNILYALKELINCNDKSNDEHKQSYVLKGGNKNG